MNITPVRLMLQPAPSHPSAAPPSSNLTQGSETCSIGAAQHVAVQHQTELAAGFITYKNMEADFYLLSTAALMLFSQLLFYFILFLFYSPSV